MSRPLAPDEAALWAQVMGSVRPLRARAIAPMVVEAPAPGARKVRVLDKAPAAAMKPAAPAILPGHTLDAGWDRRLARGAVSPDRIVDLHGHTLQSAHALLDRALAGAVAEGARVVLLVTGRPPRAESERPHARGAIRASVEDWIALSRHAGHIASVRAAHPRHGGAGALYLILRRPRDQQR